MTALATSKRRLKCPVCDRTVDRNSRQQQFCSTRCRKRHWRDKIPADGGDTRRGTNPHKSSSENNILQWPKLRSRVSCKGVIGPRRVIETEVIAGRSWDEVISADEITCYVSRLTQRALRDGGA